MFHLVLESHDGRAPGADSEEKHEPVSDIDTVVVDSLKALDPKWPIREVDVGERLPGGVPDDEAPPIQLGVGLVDGPGRREAAGRHVLGSTPTA